VHAGLITAYVIAALFEIVGIGLVIVDWRSDRRRAQALIELPMKVHGGTRTSAPSYERSVMRHGGEAATKLVDTRLRSVERQLRALLSNYEQADTHLRDALQDQLDRSFMERVRAPGLLVLGVLIGATANIVALYAER
jgi:hypothetical protein